MLLGFLCQSAAIFLQELIGAIAYRVRILILSGPFLPRRSHLRHLQKTYKCDIIEKVF